jgi:hypothetical protein
MRLLRAATLSTPDPEGAARRYQEWFGYQTVEMGAVSPALASSWGAPAMAGRRYCVVAPESGVPVFLRFVEASPAPDFRALRSFGWGAIELCVQDVLAVHARMKDSPFTIIGPPRALDGAPAIWPMQVQGPDGEVVFLTEIRADEPGARLPRAASAVDCLFIAVLACRDMAATRAWFEARLNLAGGPDFTLAYTTLSRAFGLDVAHQHRIAVLGHGEDAFLQLDQYPAAAEARDVPAGELPPGVAMVSFALPGLETGERHPGVIYGGGRSEVWRTPEGALVEVIG